MCLKEFPKWYEEQTGKKIQVIYMSTTSTEDCQESIAEDTLLKWRTNSEEWRILFFYGLKLGKQGKIELFWRKTEKSCRKIWWNEKKVLPLHSLLRTKRLGSYQSGQMGQTVNLLAMPSVVRIHHYPLFPK